jgi:DNA-binding NarL/FixJ family response regulator
MRRFLIFGLHVDLQLARTTLQMGACSVIRAGMTASQVVRAVTVAASGEIVTPRKLLHYLVAHEDPVDFNILSARQREVLQLVTEGLSNAQLARRLYLSESTVKQHLHAAYKLLGVSKRTEAAALMRGI